ncbi:MAG TPA: FHA domain-containing protein, partial [Myxococcota bacterium]
EGDALVVGRAADCDLVLAQEEVSRRHARFTRSGDRYEIHDLGSVNGTLVNGKRTERHVLAVGDVITIESFQLTFVLDHEPISSVMKPSAVQPGGVQPSAMQPSGMQSGMQPAAARPEHGEPFGSSGAEQTGAASADASPPPDATIANITLEEDLFAAPSGLDFSLDAEDEPADEHKELAAVQPRGGARAATIQQLGTPSAESAVVTIELRVRADQLPEPLRRALAETGELVIPADLRLRA